MQIVFSLCAWVSWLTFARAAKTVGSTGLVTISKTALVPRCGRDGLVWQGRKQHGSPQNRPDHSLFALRLRLLPGTLGGDGVGAGERALPQCICSTVRGLAARCLHPAAHAALYVCSGIFSRCGILRSPSTNHR